MNSQGILYPEPSQDPIFLATKPYDLGFDIGVKYLRPSQRDNVLGCVDSIRWRVPDISATWYDLSGRDRTGTYFNPDWLKNVSPQSRGGFRLLVNSLTFSRIGMNIQSRQGMGLAASKLLEAGYSYKIAEEQWKKEARQLFETSLTRIQISARDFAQGGGAKYGLQRIEQGRKELCDGTFLFKSQGWQNVHVAGSAWVVLWSVVVVLMAVPLDDERLLIEPVWQALCTFLEFTKDISPKCYHKANRWAWDIRIGARITLAKLKRQVWWKLTEMVRRW